MKVLYLVSGIGPPAGWGTEFIQELIFKLSQKGVGATIINPIYKHTYPDWEKWTKEQEDKYGVRIISLDAPNIIKKNLLLHFVLTPFFVTFVVIKVLLKEKFDLVHEFSSTPIILFRSLLLKIFFKLPTVFTLSVYNNTLLGKFFWFRMFDFAKFYCIPSREIVKIMVQLGIDKNKIYFCTPGINLDNFKKHIEKSAARKKLNLPPDKKIVSFFGSLTSEKGIPDLLEATDKISNDLKDKLLVAIFAVWKGSSTHEKWVKKINEMKPTVKLFQGKVSIPDVIWASDAIVLPQRTGHGTTIPPISVIETLAVGKPLIVTNIIGVEELTNIRSNILLIEPNNLNDLKAAIEKVCEWHSSNNKSASLINRFSIQRSAKLNFEIYQKVMV